MKKTVKVLGLLLVAAAMFTGCKQNVEEPSTPSIDGELFSKEDTTVTASAVELSDGNWTFRLVAKDDNETGAGELTFSAANGSLDATKDFTFKFSQKGTIPAGTTEAEIEEAKADGYTVDGDKYSFYKEFDAKSLTEYMSENPDDDITDCAEMMLMIVMNPSVSANSSVPIKTNSDKTKFFAEQTKNEATMTMYFAKN